MGEDNGKVDKILAEMSGALGRAHSVIEDLHVFVTRYPGVAKTMLPDEKRAGARARLNKVSIDEYTLHARVSRLAEAVSDIRKLRHELVVERRFAG